MTNTIDINVNNTASSCHIDLYNKELDKNISFVIYNISLLSQGIQKEDSVNAYSLDNTAIVEATTYTNSLLLTVDEDDMELVSEDTNRMAIYINNMPIAQITTLSIIDEEGNHLHSSLQQRDGGVEVVVEEELAKATKITIQFAPYINFESSNMSYLRSFGELDYWYDMLTREIFTVNKYNYKESYIKLSSLYISGSNYLYQAPAMISETVFFSNYKKCFYKINGSNVDKIKDETSFIGMTYLYDNVWLTVTKGTNAYTYNIIEFTDVETATYEVKDTYTITIGKSVSEYYYMPYVNFNYGDQLRVIFYTYQFNSYLPATADQYLCASINKETRQFDFTDIEPNKFLIYKNDDYTITFDWADRKHYINGTVVSTYYTYPTKPLTLIENDKYYGVVVGNSNSSTSDMVCINLKTAVIETKSSVVDKLWSNGAYSGRKSENMTVVYDAWDVFKDTDIDKRHVRVTTKDDFIIPDNVEVVSNSYAKITAANPIYIKREVVQNKKFFINSLYTQHQLYQRENIIAAGITVSEYTDVEIRPYSSINFWFNDSFIVEEDKDFNIYTSVSDIVRQAETSNYELIIDDSQTIFDKVEDKYDLSFKKWEDYTETFEDYPNTLIKWTNSTYDEHGLLKSDKRAKDGIYSGYMGREEKGGSSVPDYYSEFVTIGDKIAFDYYNSFTQYSQYLKVYVNDIQSFNDYANSKDWLKAEVSLKKNQLNTVKIFYEDGTATPSNDKGFFIDNLKCKVPAPSNEAEVYLKPVDLGFYDAPQGVNIIFNDVETSSDVTRQLFYSINGGQEWLELTGMLPNVDNILLKAVFTKTSDDAYVRFSSIEVMPGEFTYTSYVDTQRHVYNTEDIEVKFGLNESISYTTRGYSLLFKKGKEVIESFENEEKVIDYNITSYANYTICKITSEHSSEGNKCMSIEYKSFDIKDGKTELQGIEFNVQAESFRFKAKQSEDFSFNKIVYYINDEKFIISNDQMSTTEFKEYVIPLDPNIVSNVKISYGSNSPGKILYLDELAYGSSDDSIYSYIESDALDLSLYPQPIKGYIEPVNLQSTSKLDITNLYSVDNGEWQSFEDTLPNVNNVKIKTVFTKASVEEVVDASFESLVIKQGQSTTGVTVLSDLDRQVVINNAISSDTCRQTSKNYISIIDTNRKVLKDMFNLSDTLRRMYITGVQVNASTIREVVKSASSINDLRRIVDKAIIAKATTKRMVIKNINSLGSTKRIVSVRYIAYSDTKRKVECLYTLIKYFDTLRNVMRTIDVELLFDTLRVIYEEESPFEAQLSIELLYRNGILEIGDQEYK